MVANTDFTLVCGGGGVWGVAWMSGLVAGLADEGFDVRDATAFVGTSAGSVVSTQLASGWSPADMFDRQTDPSKQPHELTAPAAGTEGMIALMQRSWDDNQQRLRAICDFADQAETISVAERRASVIERLGLADGCWPDKKMSVCGIDMESFDLTVFDSASGVPLIDAVSASTAVPGVWPPTPINGRRYIDGGLWKTAENAHVAAGARAVLILSPVGRMAMSGLGGSGLDNDVRALEAQGAQVHVIYADGACLRTAGPGLMDPATRAPSAQAGRIQGRQEIGGVRETLGL